MPHVHADAATLEAADDALISVGACLDDYRGGSRFSTWASKFALREAAVKLRRHAWQERELPEEPGLSLFADQGTEPDAALEQRELVDTVQRGSSV